MSVSRINKKYLLFNSYNFISHIIITNQVIPLARSTFGRSGENNIIKKCTIIKTSIVILSSM